MPTQVVASDGNGMRFGERHEAVDGGEVKCGGRRAQGLPFHRIFRDEDAGLLRDDAGIERFAVEPAHIDREAEAAAVRGGRFAKAGGSGKLGGQRGGQQALRKRTARCHASTIRAAFRFAASSFLMP